jgi:serine/threonine-protein kinase
MTEHVIARPRASAGDSPALSLPPDLLDQAQRRLSLAALIYASAYAVAFIPGLIATPAERSHPVLNAIAFGIIGGSAAFGLALQRWRPAAAVVDRLAMWFQVFGALGIEYGLPWWLEHGPEAAYGLSWSCVWIAIYPVIVPTSLGRATAAALLAASVRPAMVGLAVARGVPGPSPGEWLGVSLPTFICAGIAVAVAKIVYGWGREVAKARQMGSYRLVELLGRGGMGEVWRAEHHMLARPAAIKLVRPDAVGGTSGGRELLLKRFEREALATAALTSPHTVQLYDFGVTADGTFYYVMELLRGLDLNELVTRFGPMPAPRVVHVLRQVCAALAEAHGVGLVHRDVKPANVYLCRAGRMHDFAKVLDFGLVKRAGLAGGDVKLTAANVATGTPAYMAPELALGDEEIDGRADLYAVGCLAYWLLTGSQVFDAPSPARVMFAHVRDTPPPPSTRAELEIPAALETLVMRCLAKDPADRPQTAEELADGLLAAVPGEAWTSDQAARWWRMHLPELAA